VRGTIASLTLAAWALASWPATSIAGIGAPPPAPIEAAPIELDWGDDRRAPMIAEPAPVSPAPQSSAAPDAPDAPDALDAPDRPDAPDAPSRVPPPSVSAAQAAAPALRVTIGLGADAPGSREEWAILDRLERGLLASTAPRATLRRLRTPISAPRRVCRETEAALVVSVTYVAQRIDPLLAAWDCDLDLELGRWTAAEAEEADLLPSIWREHDAAIASGEAIAGKSRRPKLPPKVRTGLIAGGVVIALGATLAILLAAGLREDRVVLTVRP
jgi:hypothetical protein